ncbi:MAG TPA: hypothetical protein VFP65_23780 [Anaeromyxobacteraceae bacterium]|nr:hypothetical protein [Anaeromyxobacteraceae bacterium]
MRRIERGHLMHDDTDPVSVRFAGDYLRLTIAQAVALAAELPQGHDLRGRLVDHVADALRETYGYSVERSASIAELAVSC